MKKNCCLAEWCNFNLPHYYFFINKDAETEQGTFESGLEYLARAVLYKMYVVAHTKWESLPKNSMFLYFWEHIKAYRVFSMMQACKPGWMCVSFLPIRKSERGAEDWWGGGGEGREWNKLLSHTRQSFSYTLVNLPDQSKKLLKQKRWGFIEKEQSARKNLVLRVLSWHWVAWNAGRFWRYMANSSIKGRNKSEIAGVLARHLFPSKKDRKAIFVYCLHKPW